MEVIFNKLCYIENKSSSLEKVFLNNINLVLSSGKVYGLISDELSIIGKLLMCIKRPTSGELKIDDIVIKRTSHIKDINLLRKKVGYVFTNENHSFIHDNVYDEINDFVKNYGNTKDNRKHIIDSLKLVGLDEEVLERNTNKLSYTEQKRVILAAILSYNPEIIILDNFDKGFSYKDKEYFKRLFIKLKNKYNKTIIVISKDLEFMFNFVDKVYLINEGNLVMSGEKDIFYNNELYRYIDMPFIVDFTKHAQKCGHNILEYTELKELIKEVYRNVK